MNIKKIAEKMHESGFYSEDLNYCLVAKKHLSELIYSEISDKISHEMKKLENKNVLKGEFYGQIEQF